MGSGGRNTADDHHVFNVDGNLMVLKTYAPLASASSADELLLLASENSSSHNSSLRRCKTSVDVSLSSMDPTPDLPATEEKASEASPRRRDRSPCVAGSGGRSGSALGSVLVKGAFWKPCAAAA